MELTFAANEIEVSKKACFDQSIEIERILSELNQIQTGDKNASNDYNSWPLDLMADNIEKKTSPL